MDEILGFGPITSLLADSDVSEVMVNGPKKMYGRETIGVYRTTFILDGEGIITKIFKRVKTKEHSEQIIKALDL